MLAVFRLDLVWLHQGLIPNSWNARRCNSVGCVGHRKAFRGTQQADDDLQFAPLAVARVSTLGQFAAVTLEVTGAHLVQDQRVLPKVTPGRGVLDGLLTGTQEPVHATVDLVFIDGAETEGLRGHVVRP